MEYGTEMTVNVSTHYVGNIMCKYTNMEMSQNFYVIFHNSMSTKSIYS